MTGAPENAELKRMDAARNFPSETCPASRHVAMMAHALIEDGSYSMLQEDPVYAGEGIASVVASLWETRAALAERDAVIAGLVEVLKPFAEYMHTEDGQMDLDNRGNPLPDDLGVGWIYLTHGDFRKARAALSRARG